YAVVASLTNANYTATNATGTLKVDQANQTITFNALAGKTFGDADFNLSASASSGLAVSFTATGQCTVSGSTVHLTGAGSCTITASQSGNGNYNAAANVQQTFQIAKASSSTAVTSSANPSQLGQSVTFTATVTSTAGTPTGTVQFKDNGTNIGSPVILNSSGVATISINSLTAGNHTVTADYNGDANFSSSTGTLSGGQQVNVIASLSISDVSLAEGDTGTKSFDFTVTLAAASNLTVKVDFATADGTATLADNDYQGAAGTLTFNPGDLTRTITVKVNGDTKNEPNETFFVNLSNAQNATISKAQGVGTILNDDEVVLQFSQSSYTVGEGEGRAAITVTRTGDTSGQATINYATSDTAGLQPCSQFNGMASQRCDYAASVGTLRFSAGETAKTIFIPVVDDAYSEGSETFTITLSSPTGGSLGTPSVATITIRDNDQTTGGNPIVDSSFFVRQQYIDLLGREPDPAGLAGWLDVLNNCGTKYPQPCDRIEVSAGFFRSPEFQNRGYFVFRFYPVALGRNPNYSEFIPDLAKVSGFLTDAQLEANKVAFVSEFMGRSEFQSKYGSVTDPTQFVDSLLQTAGLPNHPARTTWINALINQTMTRAQVLRALAESAEAYQKFYNQSFVVMQYFGYLRRDPDILYLRWVDTMNKNGGDYRTMINGFMNSPEYFLRFGP
ncbi:MAG: Ig-like domain repeat protein, partial [Acidobacteriota bacterium]|nr:Ig-like domain repeat protein [Acidobacteriota bacterium]